MTFPNISAPATIDVKVTASQKVSELPESIKFKNIYKIKCMVGEAFATSSASVSQLTFPRDEFPEFLDDMIYTVHFKLSEDGSLSMSVD